MQNKNLRNLLLILAVVAVGAIAFIFRNITASEFSQNLASMGWARSLLFVIVGILFTLAIREIVTWYWKINRMVNLLEKIENNTRK